MWQKYKAGDETESIADGVATTLIRIGAAALVEEIKHDDTPKPAHDESQQSDSSNRSDSRANNAGGSKETVVPGGIGHKPGRRVNQPNSGRP
jgi:hypothetical protein